jgi:hypothetical protein
MKIPSSNQQSWTTKEKPMHEMILTRTWERRTATATLKRLLLGVAALLFVASCTDDGQRDLVGPKGLAHIPSFSTVQTPSGATFTTDKDDYAPGETLNLSGTNWPANDVLAIHLDETPQNHDPVNWSITVGDDGSFTDGYYTVQESDLGVTFTITATSQATGETATATFTDAIGAGSLCADAPSAGTAVCPSPATTPTATLNDTHYKQRAGTSATYQIIGATDALTGTNGCPTGEVAVQIQHSAPLSNVVVCGSFSNNIISFTWAAPSNYCETGPVAYRTSVQGAGFDLSNNDIIADGTDNGSPNSTGGIGYVDASGTVIACGGGGNASPPTTTKTADGSYKNTFVWTITKDVDKTLVKQIGGSATFNYTIKVSHDNGTISDIVVSGTITVNNPNSADITGADVTDALSDATNCTVTGGSNATLAPGDNTFAYTCSVSGSVVPSGLDNTATVRWAAQSVGGNSLAAGSAPFTFGDVAFTGNDVDECVDVSDSYAGSLGTACVGDANPTTFTYSRTITVPQFDCKSYDNTAKFTTNDLGETGSASQTVTVCGPAKTGALTIGFWKTTNGQNLIKTYCANTLDDYLAGLGGGSGPFSDAAGKNCTQLAQYVYSILNGATATDMNKMLKAQMLGTALDVWFSGPGWTPTKSGGIKPPSNFLSHNSLGTFKMDLTAVCPMVDNTSAGSATCLNNTPSTDAVAAGAVPTSPMSMQAILDFAATTPSPFNGSTSSSVWYGGNRTQEEILKNIFDQFNNQMAFGSF